MLRNDSRNMGVEEQSVLCLKLTPWTSPYSKLSLSWFRVAPMEPRLSFQARGERDYRII